MDFKPASKLTYAVDAEFLVGGQGLNFFHVAEILRSEFQSELFGRSAGDRACQAIAPSGLAATFGRIPVVRRNRHWQVLWQSRHFDRMVAGRLTSADIFLGTSGSCLRSLTAARKLGSRIALDVTTLHVDEFGERQDREAAKFDTRPSLHPWQRAQSREEYLQADLIRVMSHVAARSLTERGVAPEKVVVVHPPLLMGEDFPDVTHESDRLRVGFVSTLEPAKGFHYLIEAFRTFQAKDMELTLWGGTVSRQVAQYVAGVVAEDPRVRHRPEAIRNVGLREVFGNMDVLVHPSLCDGFAYVVGEAMACGIPAIVTSTSGAADLIEDGVNGFIVPPADPGAIRDRLLHLRNHPGCLSPMGAAARATASRFTLDQSRSQFLPRLKALLD